MSLEDRVRQCEAEAERARQRSGLWGILGVVLAPVTFGASAVIAAAPTLVNANKADRQLAEAVAAKMNVDITRKAVHITREKLIPSVRSFISALTTCATFLETLQMQLKNMSRQAQLAVDKRKVEQSMQLHYKKMKANATDIKENCSSFCGAMVQVKLQSKIQ